LYEFSFTMPTALIVGRNCLVKNSKKLRTFGNRCLIVTGRRSSKLNGSLEDSIIALENENIKYTIFDKVEETPSLETVSKAYEEYKDKEIDFILAVGCGSAIDAAKAISILLKNRITTDALLSLRNLQGLPLVAVPTTAGTGSEATPYSILTLQDKGINKNIGQQVFPTLAFLDARYTLNTPLALTLCTAIDAFSHLAEGYLNTRANLLTDTLAEKGLRLFGQAFPSLLEGDLSIDVREKLLMASTLGGMVISQTGTSLPHGMGYPLTYEKGVPHGVANGLLYPGYLKCFQKKEKLHRLYHLIQVPSGDALMDIFKKLLPKTDLTLSKEDIKRYVDGILSNEKKLKNHPEKISRDELVAMYETRLHL